MNEEDENLINNRKQKKQLMAFSKKIEEIISEYKNRKKFGIPKLQEDSLQKVDLKQYNEFFEQIEEHKNMVNAYKIKLNNDDKFVEVTKKEDELKYLKIQYKAKEKEYKHLIDSNKRLNGFQNNVLEEEIKYYDDELKKLKNDIFIQNKEFGKYSEDIKSIRDDIHKLETEYDLVHKNIEFKKFEITLNKNMKINLDEDTNEILETEKEAAKIQLESVEKEYNRFMKEKNKLEKEVIELKEILSKYQYDAHLNDLKIKEIEKIENELKLNKNKEKTSEAKKLEEKTKRAKKMKNLMAESFKNNFPFKNNYKILIEEEKKQNKPKLLITKNRMKNSFSSIDIFNSKREELKKKREKEKQEFMSNLDKELKDFERQNVETIQEIKSLRDEIEKSLESNKIYDNCIDNIKKEKE